MQLNVLIESAAEIAGSQRKLAALLGLQPAHLIEMKKGQRTCNWRTRGKLRAILGEDPAHAFMAAIEEDLATSENEEERKAAEGFRAMLAAFPSGAAKEKAPEAGKQRGLEGAGGEGGIRTHGTGIPYA